MKTEAKNGMYMERGDFPSYNDEFVQVYRTVHPKAEASKEEDEMLCKSVTFCVTESCNLACTYCYECHKSNRRMSWETAKKIVDGLFEGEFVDNTAPAIILDFIGGEPLLEIDLIDRTVDYFKKKAFSLKHPWAYYYMISISTNGVLFDTPKVQEFIRKNYEHLSIGISIDGDKALHDSCRLFHDGSGSYDVVSKAAKHLLRLYPAAGTKVTLVPENLPYLVGAIQHLYRLGYHNIPANCVFEDVWREEHPKMLYDKLIELADWMIDNEIYRDLYVSLFEERFVQIPSEEEYARQKVTAYCGGNGRMVAFDPQGKAYPCLRYMKHSLTNQPERPIGELEIGYYTDRKTTDWYQKLQKVTTWSSADSECRNCPALPLCPTCIAWQYDATGDPNCKTKHHCAMFKAQIAANYYYWTKLYRKLGLNKQAERLFEAQSYEREGEDER